jgi:hypothetical protein
MASATRDLFVSANNESISDLQEIILKLSTKSEAFTFSEIADMMSSQEHELFISKIRKFTKSNLEILVDNSEYTENDDQNIDVENQIENSIKSLNSICRLINLYLETKIRPKYLFKTILSLHDILITLDIKYYPFESQFNLLKMNISKVCEFWWNSKENNAESIITQLLPYLLLNSLSQSAHESDIKRLHKIQSAFLLLDFDDTSIESIRQLILQCLVSPLYIKYADGKRFISFLFSLHSG